MKNIFKSILAFVAGAVALASCADYDTILLSDQMASVSAESISFAAVPSAPKTVTVSLDGDWIAILPAECDWLKVEPSYGTGKTDVKITAADNYDGVGAMAGPRSTMVNFTTTAGSSVLNVSQMGDITKLSAKTYKLVKDVTPGASYLLVAKNGAEYYAGTPVPTSSTYAYLTKKDVTANVQADGSIVMPDGSYGFTFEPSSEKGKYLIRQADGEALWQSASYNNFYTDVTPQEGCLWTVEPQADGTVKIMNNVDKWMQYSISYSSYGGYSGTQDQSLLPYLYENADKVLGVTPSTVALADGDLEEEFTVVCDADLVDAVIPEDCDWITLVSNVSDGVKSTLTFKSSKNPDLADRSATILVGSVDATANVSVDQPSRALTPDDKGTLEIPMTVADAIAAANAGQTNSVYVKGIVSKLITSKNKAGEYVPGFNADYGNGSFWISADGVYNDDLTKDFEAYQVNWLGNQKWAEGNAQIAEGCEVLIYGPLTVYKGTAETQGKGAAYVYSVNTVLTDAEGIGSVDDPFTAVGACVAAKNAVAGKVYVEGVVSKLVNSKNSAGEYVPGFISDYGNGSFWISADGNYYDDKTKDFEAYQVYWLGGNKWTDSDPQIALNDKVVIYGPLTTYKETCETQGKGAAYVYSLNGKTSLETE